MNFRRLFAIVICCASVLACSAAQMIVQWDYTHTTETGFAIERATGLSGSFVEIARIQSGTLTYTDTNVAASTTYSYRLRAYQTDTNGTIYSAYSNTASATTAAGGGSTSVLVAPVITSIQ